MNTNKQNEPNAAPKFRKPGRFHHLTPQQMLCLAAKGLCSHRFVFRALIVLLSIQSLVLIIGLTQRFSLNDGAAERAELIRQLTEARANNVSLKLELDKMPELRSRLYNAERALNDAFDFAYNVRGGQNAATGSGSLTATGTEASAGESDAEIDHDAPPPLRPEFDGSFEFDDNAIPVDRYDPATANAAADDTGLVVQGQSQLRAEDAEDAESLIRQGVSALVAGDMRRCILSFEEASLIAPNHPALLYFYGVAYDKLLNHEKAREYYTLVFNMGSSAGGYFERATRRLKHGFDQPSDMRGKISFGPYTHSHIADPGSGESVSMRLPIFVAPDTDLSPQDIFIHIQFFVLVNGRKIRYSPTDPTVMWENETQDWGDNEENILISYELPPLSREELDAYGEMTYYGFTAKLYYKGEPLDCISNPSALILHEQLINAKSASRKHAVPASLLPDDGLALPEPETTPYPDTTPELPSDEAASSAPAVTPFAEYIEEIDPSSNQDSTTPNE